MFSWKNKKFFLSLVLLLFPLSSFSYDFKGEAPMIYVPHLVFGMGGAYLFTNDAGESQTFPITNIATDEKYSYKIDESYQSGWALNGFIGREWHLDQDFYLQLAVSYYHFGELQAKGVLTQGADPGSSSNYDYSYNIRNYQILLESKWFYERSIFKPYFSFGLGASINKASGYEVDIPNFVTFSRVYEDKTYTSFSYSVGTGLDFNVGESIRLGVGYRFSDLGKVTLGKATIDGATVKDSLYESHFCINLILAQVTFLLL